MSTPTPASKPKALIIIPSAAVLPLTEPAGHPGVSTGFYLVELAQILKEFSDEYEFTFATPGGLVPQLEINGLGLSMHAAEKFGSATVSATAAQAFRFDVDTFRTKRPELVARRDSELALARRYLGRLPVSESLPGSDKEVVVLRDDLIKAMQDLPEHSFPSVDQLVRRHHDAEDSFDLGAFDFVHMPGGHAPMVDFVDNPWIGELLHTLRENGVLISLICHAPVAMASAKYRVGADGAVVTDLDHAFRGVRVTTVAKSAELFVLSNGYLKIPGKKVRMGYFIDEALRDAGYKVETTTNPTAVKVIWEEGVRLLTSNGPQSIDEHAARLRTLLRRH
ncbi:DJ-1/PfpI family protein [Streptomyces sp. NBC_01451]|uniref:DJ-1/PfpI family protein n=1 Tax=Streptomyces sp. NBC_01451 TaxID=2903872 RepID=UPI002E30110A|nr:DJ-1/PfpI family protein [Streptomyces sp. NBC_01451]